MAQINHDLNSFSLYHCLIRQLTPSTITEKKESKAATRIQANFRGHKTRQQLAGQEDIDKEGDDEEFPNDGNDDCPGMHNA